MAKGIREKIKLESTAGTGHFYTTSKNKRTTPQKLETIYLAFLGRQPNSDEKAILDQVARERGDKAVADVTHALITGSQFLFVQ